MANIKLKDLLSEGNIQKINEEQLNEFGGILEAGTIVAAITAGSLVLGAMAGVSAAGGQLFPSIKDITQSIGNHFAGKKVNIDDLAYNTAAVSANLPSSKKAWISKNLADIASQKDQKHYAAAGAYMRQLDDYIKRNNPNYDSEKGSYVDDWNKYEKEQEKKYGKDIAPNRKDDEETWWKKSEARKKVDAEKNGEEYKEPTHNPYQVGPKVSKTQKDKNDKINYPDLSTYNQYKKNIQKRTDKEKDSADTNRDAKLQQLAKLQQQKAQQDKQKAATGGASANQQKVASTQQPSAQPAQDISKLKVKNPETGNDISVKAALTYDKNHPVYKAAQAIIAKNNK